MTSTVCAPEALFLRVFGVKNANCCEGISPVQVSEKNGYEEVAASDCVSAWVSQEQNIRIDTMGFC